MYYPAIVQPDGDHWLVVFPDIPEAITAGATKAEAIEFAIDALQSALEVYFEDRREIPVPSRVKRDQVSIELPASMAAKVLLLNEMIRQRVRPADLARRLRTTPQEVTRLTQLRHPTKIDGIDHALNVLGKRLELRAIEA